MPPLPTVSAGSEGLYRQHPDGSRRPAHQYQLDGRANAPWSEGQSPNKNPPTAGIRNGSAIRLRVAVILRSVVTNEDEAVAIANGTEFGLYDYVFTGDTNRGMRVARQLRTGNVGINTAQRNHEAPFGGFKMSGVGRDGGSFGLHAYSELQSIVWPG